jgi:hypothetical protein
VAVRVSVRGEGDLRRAATQLRAEARTLQFNVNQGVRRGTKGFKNAIVAGVPQYMPSGYAPLLARAVRVQTVARSAGVSLKVSAKGKRELRDLDARDRGSLRHPPYGWRKARWHDQKVRRGVVEDPFDRMKPQITRELEDVLDGVRQRIERG